MAARKPKVNAADLQYHGNEASGGDATRSIVASHEGKIVGLLKSEITPESGVNRKLALAWVDPNYRRKGVAATMIGLEHDRMGYKPIGDTVVSPEGKKLQQGTGTPQNPRGEVVSSRIAQAFVGARQEDVQRLQEHVLSGQQFDPKLVKLVAPYKAPRRKREPAPVQDQLFDPTDY